MPTVVLEPWVEYDQHDAGTFAGDQNKMGPLNSLPSRRIPRNCPNRFDGFTGGSTIR